ncbi:hypothetical protein COCSADRAFT_285040 [Bipolaris sorokiniana ND90Pr]|uniref:Uncharacterized protein n=1 Tax=Cochliobolus sativus (strain ND90Pr / ATCC 201652) TaxID=665912 RepID=M2SIW5_COCSN|nr:uncharacterized protein COCSADRAFT_285040 [Bipolaris sorokiniana ND90Pr]EMD67123.1 hypothetical protein COCSADRAFT_285040 [Bipolaris sorokiniana ND90Pr]
MRHPPMESEVRTRDTRESLKCPMFETQTCRDRPKTPRDHATGKERRKKKFKDTLRRLLRDPPYRKQ